LRLFTVCGLIFSSSRQQISFGRNQAKQWWPLRLQGIVTLAEAQGLSERKWGKILQPRLVDLSKKDSFGAAQRPCAQRSVSTDKRFWLLLSHKSD
jgi:hypothetical protein